MSGLSIQEQADLLMHLAATPAQGHRANFERFVRMARLDACLSILDNIVNEAEKTSPLTGRALVGIIEAERKKCHLELKEIP